MSKKSKVKWSSLSPEEKEQRRKEAAERNAKRLLNYNPVMAARNALRREFSRSPLVIEMMKENSRTVPLYKKDGTRAAVDAREHLCAKCGEWKRNSKGKKATIDHIEPVVCPKVGFVDLNTYYARMWVPKEKLQKLCGDCHNEKTQAEWFHRRFKEELELVEKCESMEDAQEVKKLLKRFTPKKWAKGPYPKDFIKRVETLRASGRGKHVQAK